MIRTFRATALAAAAAAALSACAVTAVASAQPGEPSVVDSVPAPPPVIDSAPAPSSAVDPTPTLATALEPAPGRSSPADARVGEDLRELARLSGEAGAMGEQLHLARSETARAVAERDRLERAASVAAGRAAVANSVAARDQQTVDHLATMRYRGGGAGGTRAAVLAGSPRELVDRLDALRRLSGATTSALDTSRAASAEAARLRDEARLASEAARTAAEEASARADELERRSAEMRTRVDEVRRRVDALTDGQRALWIGGPLVPPGYVAPEVDDVNSAALGVALTRLGAQYTWGATGPSEFDCSGLMVWAYAQEGKTLPRSSQAQALSGAPVAAADMRPGDLVIYYPDATHVGMYAGDGLVLHAPTYGVPVRLEKVDAMPVSAIRRY